MIKPRIMSAVLVCGLGVGLSVGWVLWGREVSQADRFAELVVENCGRFLADGETQTAGLEPVPALGPQAFGDPDTLLVVVYSPRPTSCSVTDVLSVMSPQDVAAVHRAARDWARHLVVPMNEAPTVFVDLTPEGVGDPMHIYRPIGRGEGAYLISLTYAVGDRSTEVSIGRSEFRLDTPETAEEINA